MKLVLAFLFLGFHFSSVAQDTVRYPKRIALVAASNAVIGGGSIVMLNSVWYSGYPKAKFHTFNDGSDWMYMDKIGHAYAAYQLGRTEYAAWRWAGLNNKKATFISSGIVFGYQLSVEVLDGLSAEWGFSVPDLVANTTGVGLFMAQQLAFKEQRFYLKYSYNSSPYAELRPNTLGSNFPEKLLKDYNAQSYWLSFHPNIGVNNFLLPKWVQLSVGYSADAKLKGDENSYTANNFTYTAHKEWALSLDVDWSKLPVKKPWLKKGLSVLNAVKLPFPAVYWRNGVCYVGML